MDRPLPQRPPNRPPGPLHLGPDIAGSRPGVAGLDLPGAAAAADATLKPSLAASGGLAPATALLLRSTRLAMATRGLTEASPARPGLGLHGDRAQARLSLDRLLAAAPASTRAAQPAPPQLRSPTHLAGFLDAAQGHCLAVPSTNPVVVMASGGGRRQLPVLTPLLALWLAREGVPVLLHGPLTDPAGVTSAEVLRNLGLTPSRHAGEVAQAWSRREPAYMATSTLCPAMAALLQREHGTAWRSLARRLVRLLSPVHGAPSLRVVHQGSNDSGQLLSAWAAQDGVSMMLLRGAEGEPVADLRRRPRIDSWLQGRRLPAQSRTAQGKTWAAEPLWPQQADAATTALYVQAMLSGERPAPGPVAEQVALILGLVRLLRWPLAGP